MGVWAHCVGTCASHPPPPRCVFCPFCLPSTFRGMPLACVCCFAFRVAIQCLSCMRCLCVRVRVVRFACGGNASNPLAATLFCPQGSGTPLTVGVGNYSTGSDDVERRSGQEQCPQGSYCVQGVKIPCPAGTFGSARGLTEPTCSGLCSLGCVPGGTTGIGLLFSQPSLPPSIPPCLPPLPAP